MNKVEEGGKTRREQTHKADPQNDEPLNRGGKEEVCSSAEVTAREKNLISENVQEGSQVTVEGTSLFHKSVHKHGRGLSWGKKNRNRRLWV